LWALSTRAPSLNALAAPGVTGEAVSLAERAESEAFLAAINEATKLEALPVQVLALGWDFASLVGTRAALESPAGSRMIPDSPATAALFAAVGVEAVRMSWAEVASALQYGATDAAVLPTELASDLVRSGAVEAIFAAPDVALFAAPYLLIMGEQVSRDFGDSVPDALRAACQAPAGEFTETNLQMQREFQSAAIETGTENVGENSEVRMAWEEAMRASSADQRSELGIGNHLLDAFGASE
jgi:TRAP-type C4-dicarboxylate transport system substrate-binding protein